MKKFQKERGFIPIFIIIVLTIVIAGVGYGAYKSFGQKSVPSGEKPLEVNFTETGNILNWDSRTESYTKDWTLLYEKPGNPAISVKLAFNENSICDLGEGEKVCDKSKLNNGDRATIEGDKNGSEVMVIKLKKL